MVAPEEKPAVLGVLKQKSALIDAQLKQILPDPAAYDIPQVREMYESAWDYNLRGGKRLRPALCMLSCEAFGGRESDALNTAAALELVQNFLLVHDDIEDESIMRRGKPCLHHIHGTGFAINVGDALSNYIWLGLISNKKLIGATKTLAVMREFAEQLDITAQGQAIEIAWIRDNKWDITEQDYFEMVKRKTANYTITRPLRIGAVIAGAGKKQVDALNKPGEKLGIAFQIQDDVLNLAGEEGTVGKEAAGDLYEGKRTLILIHLLSKLKGDERDRVIKVLSKPRSQKTAEEMTEVLELCKQKGSIEYARKKSLALAEEARELFAKRLAALPDTPAKQSIMALVDFIVQRNH